MSRTDKDAPWWTQDVWWEPVHYRCLEDHGRNGRQWWRRQPRNRECDLPREPVTTRGAMSRNGYFLVAAKSCVWEPVWPWRGTSHWGGPSKRFRDHVWNNLERRRSRDECIKAGKEYRADGEVDVVPTTEQHRHRAQWLWW